MAIVLGQEDADFNEREGKRWQKQVQVLKLKFHLNKIVDQNIVSATYEMNNLVPCPDSNEVSACVRQDWLLTDSQVCSK